METQNTNMESHSKNAGFVRDVIIGMSDGITVPFAIAAGLASTGSATSTIVITAILAEIAAGSISMGLGGYLAAHTDAEHYRAERAREEREVEEKPDVEEREVIDALKNYGLTEGEGQAVVNSLKNRKKDWVDFMMRFELGLEEPNENQSFKSAVTIGGSYIIGGVIPLSPYLFIHSVPEALIFSVAVTAIALLVFGFLRGVAIGGRPWKSMLQTLLVGGIAAGAAFLLAKIVP
jgi:VIT1/CCC1 family predicted Fe2+/Mn2+ transporter